MIYSLVQAGPLFPGGALDAATLEAAQEADPALKRVRRWFPAGKSHAQLAPDQVSATLESEGGPEMSWYVSNRKKLRMVSMGKDQHHVVGILKGQGEPGQGDGQVASLVPPELRGQVIEFSHTTAHLGEAKTLAGITRYFSWGKMRADVHRYIEHCPVCVEKQVPNLKEGVHVPRVSHQQNEVLYMDLIGLNLFFNYTYY